MIEFAKCVEACITGITLRGNKQIEISLHRASGETLVLVASEVERFVANEFRERNIVDRVNFWNFASDPSEFRECLTFLVSGVWSGHISEAFLPLIENEIAAIKRDEKVLVEIEPVYGVSAVILAKTVALIPKDER